jgi:hypothetical protein
MEVMLSKEQREISPNQQFSTAATPFSNRSDFPPETMF